MKTKKTAMAAAAILTAMAAAPILHAGQKFQETIVVRGSAPRAPRGELALTFSTPVSVPGMSLGAGTYLFRDVNASAVLLSDSSGKPYKWLMTMPRERATATDDFSILMERNTYPDAPRRIIAIFAPGQHTGREFMYPNQ
jgi:hypothetical protein